ncbi:sodium-independent sulfate anion transporter isoform 2-T2 [Pholidichthys leucotaenia]
MDWLLDIRQSALGCCSCNTVKAWLPILSWLPQYNLKWLRMDFLAGLTVGLTVVPQALAYAEVAGLPVQYGLYSAFMGGFIYTFLGTSKDVTLGPTAIMSLLCFSVVGGQPNRAVLLTLLCGIIQAAMALLRLGFLLDFISFPVIKGFTCAAAVTISFGQVKGFGGGLALIPFMGLLESIAIAKAFASQNDYRIDANQELLAIGVTNIMGSFVSAYPVTGSFGRTAVNSQTGVCTPAGGIVTSVIVLLSLEFLMPAFYYIPKASLAAVIICAVAPMVDYRVVPKMWRIRKLDLLPFFVTFLMSFWEVQYGIIAGVAVSGVLLLHTLARPQIKMSDHGVLVMELSSGLTFPATEYLSHIIHTEALQASPPRSVVLDCCHVSVIDYTVISELRDLLRQFKLRRVQLVFSGLQLPVLKVLEAADLQGFRYTDSVDAALQMESQSLLHDDQRCPNTVWRGDI